MRYTDPDHILFLLGCYTDAEGPAKKCIQAQLEKAPVYAAVLNADGSLLFQNSSYFAEPPPLDIGSADTLELIIPGRGGDMRCSVSAKRSPCGEVEHLLITGSGAAHGLISFPFKKALLDKMKFSELLDNSPVITVIVILNETLDLAFMSGNIRQLGFSREMLLTRGISWASLIHEEERDAFLADVRRLTAISSRFSSKYRIRTLTGDILHIQSDMIVLRDRSGLPMYLEGTIVDITEQASLEDAIKASTDSYNRGLDAILDTRSSLNLLEIIDYGALDDQFGRLAEEYGLHIRLSGSNREDVGSWAPRDSSAGAAVRQPEPPPPSAGGEPVISCENGLHMCATTIRAGERIAAHCHFWETPPGRYDDDDFRAVTELVQVICGAFSDACTQSIELMRQVDKTHLLLEATDQDYRKQLLISQMISTLYNPMPNSEIVAEMLALAGSHLKASYMYLYEFAPDGGIRLSGEWRHADFLPLPESVRRIENASALLDESTDAASVLAEDSGFARAIGARSALHFPIYHREELCGVLGIAECVHVRDWDQDFLGSVFRVLSGAVLWKQSRQGASMLFKSLSSMLEGINALIFVSDYHSQEILFANSRLLDALERDSGFSPQDRPAGGANMVFPEGLRRFVPAKQDLIASEYLLGGRWYKSTHNLIDWTDGRKAQLVCLFDIHEIKEQELKIEYSAYHDPLLGIYNRRRFEIDLDEAMRQAGTRSGALILFDLDDFKYINDAYGHDKGDEVLRRFVASVRSILGESLYRYGGDEFMALLQGIEPARLHDLVNEIVHVLQSSVSDSEEEVMCTASIGVARYPRDGHLSHDILRSVDMAMYQAKQQGKGSAVFFTQHMESKSHRHARLEQLLKREVELGCPNMTLFYQPIFHTASDRIFGAEALLRWHSPDLGTVMPDEFVDLAEMLGLMHAVGGFVLERAVSDVSRLRASGLDIAVSVNLFMRQLQSTELAAQILELLDRHGCPPSALMLEMTEQMSLYDYQRRYSQMKTLRQHGVLVCADDFGSGQSASSHLRDGLWNLVKIDCKGIRNIHRDQYTRTFVKSRIRIAHAAGVGVCAEGVENEEQRALLAAFGCDYIQGYLMDYPMPFDILAEKYGGITTGI